MNVRARFSHFKDAYRDSYHNPSQRCHVELTTGAPLFTVYVTRFSGALSRLHYERELTNDTVTDQAAAPDQLEREKCHAARL
jgi:hypothetical protein